MTDVFSDILNTVVLGSAVYFRTNFYPEFGVAVPPYGRAARFHLVVQGRCHLTVDGTASIILNTGDLALVPHGNAHRLTSRANLNAAPLAEAIEASGFAGVGPFIIGEGPAEQCCKMVCGHFTFADGADHPLLRAMPPVLHLTQADRLHAPMLDDVLRLLSQHMFEGEPELAASVSRLSEIVFIEAIRAGANKSPEMAGLMSAVSDPHLGSALALIHGDIAADWTVGGLAKATGMSRSRFAEKFREGLGCGPMAYIAEWRLQRALARVTGSDLPIKLIAHEVGYHSAAAFTRAFTERFGVSPKQRRAG